MEFIHSSSNIVKYYLDEKVFQMLLFMLQTFTGLNHSIESQLYKPLQIP
jgi:hypothetical protein